MRNLQKINLFILTIFLFAFIDCKEITVPKPKGYFRIDFPEKSYITFHQEPSKSAEFPFTFEYPTYGNLSFQPENSKDPGWFDIEFPSFKAKIYFTYRDIKDNFEGLMEQNYKMNVKNHISKADAINEKFFNDTENKVFGVLYDLKGNTATAVQFYLTDSIKHYLRGSLYFSAEPNADSLFPVIEFFRDDIIHLIESLKWKDK